MHAGYFVRVSIVAITAVSALATPGGAQQPAPREPRGATEQELTALYRAMMAATTRGDSAALARVWSPEYVHMLTTPDGTLTWTRDERLRGVAAIRADDSISVESLTVEYCAVRVHDKYAAGPCFETLRVRTGGRSETMKAIVMVVFLHAQGDRWRIASTHSTELMAR
jgi:ketosteroid isomerase-like protein